MIKNIDVILVGFNHRLGDAAVLTVGRKSDDENVKLINLFHGKEAEDLYKKLTTVSKVSVQSEKKKVEDFRQHEFSSGSVSSQDYKEFQQIAKRELFEIADEMGFVLYSFQPNHYCFSAVLQDVTSSKFLYISVHDVRGSSDKWFQEVLYRKMANSVDWTGGQNHYCKWSEISEILKSIKEGKIAL